MTVSATQVPARKMPPRFLYKIINPIFTLVLNSPLHVLLSKHLLLLTFIGQKSGKIYTIPVGYSEDGKRLLLMTASPWSRNLRGGTPVRVRLCGRLHAGVATVLTDEAAITAAFGIILAHAPQLSSFVGITLNAEGQPDPVGLARARANGHVVIEVRLPGTYGRSHE